MISELTDTIHRLKFSWKSKSLQMLACGAVAGRMDDFEVNGQTPYKYIGVDKLEILGDMLDGR
eukprot:8187091-Karenia_brevis.AAC.1